MRDLFTATIINMYLMRLQGTIPYCWGQPYTTTYFGTTRGFTRLTQMYFWGNNLTGERRRGGIDARRGKANHPVEISR